MALSPAQEARYAHNNGIDRAGPRPNVQAEYDRLNAGGWPQPQQPQSAPLIDSVHDGLASLQ
jgi:hypothetical protein